MKVLWAVSLVVLAIVIALQFGIGGEAPLASIAVSFRVLASVIGAVLVGVLLVLGVARRRLRRRFAVTFIASIVIACVAVATTTPTSDRTPTDRMPSDSTLTSSAGLRILEWNVAQGGVDASSILGLVSKTKPDIVVLAELYKDNLPRVSGWTTPPGYDVVGTPDIAVTVLVNHKLGNYSATAADESGATSGFVAQPTQQGSPRIVATHLSRQSVTGDQQGWRTGLNWVSRQCDRANTVVVGDLNTTAMNVGSLNKCDFTSQSAAGSWPTWLPSTLGASIDNVLTTSDWNIESLQTIGNLDRAGSDHRPVFAVITHRG